MSGLIVDNFAGGGGASSGIEAALGRAVDIAINHDEDAIRMHEVNHPSTCHIRNNIWQIDPEQVVRDLYAKVSNDNPTRNIPINPITRLPLVDLAWFSPDCKHFSKAKGGKPREKSIRDLAWVVVLWAQRVKPAVIMLENVEEFRTWGPLCHDGFPIKERAGETFDKWQRELIKAGYKIEWREMRACDYGAPTIRKRFFMVARSDGKPIVWPKPTHGKPDSPDVLSGKLKPWRTAADIIDWSISCPSIFDRKKPLAEKTLRRIAHGIMKYVVNNPKPFIVPADATSNIAPFATYAQQGGANRSLEGPLHTVTASRKDQNCAVMAFMQKFAQNGLGYDPSEPLHTVMAGAPRHAVICAHVEQANGGPNNKNLSGRAADAPLSTVATTGSQQRLITSNLIKLRNNCTGQPVDEPLHTISAGGTHMGEIRAFLVKYYGNEKGGDGLENPLGTVTVNDRFGLVIVTIQGEEYVIVDIGMRMLTPRELFNAQGFRPDYIIDHDADGKPMTKTSQVGRCGNSVSPPHVEQLVDANFAESVTERKAA